MHICIKYIIGIFTLLNISTEIEQSRGVAQQHCLLRTTEVLDTIGKNNLKEKSEINITKISAEIICGW